MNYTLLSTNITPDGVDYSIELPDGTIWTLHSAGGAPADLDGWIQAQLLGLAAAGIIPAQVGD